MEQSNSSTSTASSVPSSDVLSSDTSALSPDSSLENSSDFEGSSDSSDSSSLNSGTKEQLESKVQQAAENGASKEEIKQMIKEFELKVNGKSVKTKIDLADEAALKRELQKAYAFNEVSQKYSNLENALKAKFEAWKNNPELAIRDLGYDPTEFSEKHLDKIVQKSKMTPEQIENERMKEELQSYKEREQKIQEQLKLQEEARKDQEALQFLKAEINEALSKHETLKPNQYTERRVAELMGYYSGLVDENGKQKYPNVTAEQVLPVLEREIEREFSTILENVPDKAIERFLSRKVLDRIVPKQEVPKPKKVAPSNPSQVKKPVASSVTEAKKDEKPKSFEEMMARRTW